MQKRLKLQGREVISVYRVVGMFKNVFKKLTTTIEKYFFTLTVSEDSVKKARFWRIIYRVNRQFDRMLLFLKMQKDAGRLQSSVPTQNKNLTNQNNSCTVSHEDYQKIFLIFFIFRTIRRDSFRRRYSKHNHLFSERKLYQLFENYFKKTIKDSPSARDDLSCSSKYKSDSQLQMTPIKANPAHISITNNDYNSPRKISNVYCCKETSLKDKIVVPAYPKRLYRHNQKKDSKIVELQLNKTEIGTDLLKTSTEIKTNIYNNTQKNSKNKILKEINKKRIRKQYGKSENLANQQQANLRNKHELEQMDKSWSFNLMLQKKYRKENVSTIFKISDSKAKPDYYTQYAFDIFHVCIISFVCFFVFVSLSTIYLININRF